MLTGDWEERRCMTNLSQGDASVQHQLAPHNISNSTFSCNQQESKTHNLGELEFGVCEQTVKWADSPH